MRDLVRAGRPGRLLKTLLLSLLGSSPVVSSPAFSHDWYPHECCHDRDCAVVSQAAWVAPASGGQRLLVVTTELGTAVVPNELPRRNSNDGRMHACFQHAPSDPFGDFAVICLFIPPLM